MTAYVLVANPYNNITGETEAVVFASGLRNNAQLRGDGLPPADLRLESTFSFESGVYDGTIPSGSSYTLGQIGINNADGGFDDLVALYSWGGAEVTLYIRRSAPGVQPELSTSLSEFEILFKGEALEMLADRRNLTLVLRDFNWQLQQVLQTNKYPGGGGLDGVDDLAGTPKPLCYGLCRNVSPVTLDGVLLNYQVHDGPVEGFEAVFDDAVVLVNAGDVADFEALSAATIAPGKYMTCAAQGVFRLGAPPAGAVTADVRGEFYSEENLADTLKAILLDRVPYFTGGAKFNNAAFTTHATEFPYRISGLYYQQPDIQVDQFLDSVVGLSDSFWFVNSQGELGLSRFKFRDAVGGIRAEDTRALQRLTSSKPVYRVVVQYARNLTVQSAQSFSISADNMQGYLSQQDYYVGSPYTGSGEFNIYIGDQKINKLGLVQFNKSPSVSWLTLAADGKFTFTAPPTQDASVTLEASYNEKRTKAVLTVHKRTDGSALTASVNSHFVYINPDGSYATPGSLHTFTATSTGLTGPYVWHVVDSEGKHVTDSTDDGPVLQVTTSTLTVRPNTSYFEATVTRGGQSARVRVIVARLAKTLEGGLGNVSTEIEENTNPAILGKHEKFARVIPLVKTLDDRLLILSARVNTITDEVPEVDADVTAAEQAKTALDNYLATLEPDWNDASVASPVVRATLEALLAEYEKALAELSTDLDRYTLGSRSAEEVLDLLNDIESQLGGAADDNTLTQLEKVTVLIPRNVELQAAYNALVTRYAARVNHSGLTVPYTEMVTAHDAWATYINGLTPAWDDVTQPTTVDRDVFKAKLDTYITELGEFRALLDTTADQVGEDLNDPAVLTPNEKLNVTIPTDAFLAVQYTRLKNIRDELIALDGMSAAFTPVDTARTAWLTYRNGLTPAWNDTNYNTPVVRATYDTKLNDYKNALDAFDVYVGRFTVGTRSAEEVVEALDTIVSQVVGLGDDGVLSPIEKQIIFIPRVNELHRTYNELVTRASPWVTNTPQVSTAYFAAQAAANAFGAYVGGLTPSWDDQLQATPVDREQLEELLADYSAGLRGLLEALNKYTVVYGDIQDVPVNLANLDYSTANGANEANRQLTATGADGYVAGSVKGQLYAEATRLGHEVAALQLYAGKYTGNAGVSAANSTLTTRYGEYLTYLSGLTNYNTSQLPTEVDPTAWANAWTHLYDALYALYVQVGSPTTQTVAELIKDGVLTPQGKREMNLEYSRQSYRTFSLTNSATAYNISTTTLSAALVAIQTYMAAINPSINDYTKSSPITAGAYQALVDDFEAKFKVVDDAVTAAKAGREFDAPLAFEVVSGTGVNISLNGNAAVNNSGSVTGLVRGKTTLPGQVFIAEFTGGDAIVGLGSDATSTLQSTVLFGVKYVASTNRVSIIRGFAEEAFSTTLTLPIRATIWYTPSGLVTWMVAGSSGSGTLSVTPRETTPATNLRPKVILSPAGKVSRLFVNPWKTTDFSETSGVTKPEDRATSGDNLIINGNLDRVTTDTHWALSGGAAYTTINGSITANALYFPTGFPTAIANDGARKSIGQASKLYLSLFRAVGSGVTGTLTAAVSFYNTAGDLVDTSSPMNLLAASATGYVDLSTSVPVGAATFDFAIGGNLTAGSGVAVTNIRVGVTQRSADITGQNTAANIVDQGDLAVADAAQWQTQVTGEGKPEDYATRGGASSVVENASPGAIVSVPAPTGSPGGTAWKFNTFQGTTLFLTALSNYQDLRGAPYLMLTGWFQSSATFEGELAVYFLYRSSNGAQVVGENDYQRILEGPNQTFNFRGTFKVPAGANQVMVFLRGDINGGTATVVSPQLMESQTQVIDPLQVIPDVVASTDNLFANPSLRIPNATGTAPAGFKSFVVDYSFSNDENHFPLTNTPSSKYNKGQVWAAKGQSVTGILGDFSRGLAADPQIVPKTTGLSYSPYSVMTAVTPAFAVGPRDIFTIEVQGGLNVKIYYATNVQYTSGKTHVSPVAIDGSTAVGVLTHTTSQYENVLPENFLEFNEAGQYVVQFNSFAKGYASVVIEGVAQYEPPFTYTNGLGQTSVTEPGAGLTRVSIQRGSPQSLEELDPAANVVLEQLPGQVVNVGDTVGRAFAAIGATPYGPNLLASGDPGANLTFGRLYLDSTTGQMVDLGAEQWRGWRNTDVPPDTILEPSSSSSWEDVAGLYSYSVVLGTTSTHIAHRKFAAEPGKEYIIYAKFRPTNYEMLNPRVVLRMASASVTDLLIHEGNEDSHVVLYSAPTIRGVNPGVTGNLTDDAPIFTEFSALWTCPADVNAASLEISVGGAGASHPDYAGGALSVLFASVQKRVSYLDMRRDAVRFPTRGQENLGNVVTVNDPTHAITLQDVITGETNSGGLLPNWNLDVADAQGLPAQLKSKPGSTYADVVRFEDTAKTYIRIDPGLTNPWVAFPAVPVSSADTLTITIVHKTTVPSGNAPGFRIAERNAALPLGRTHINFETTGDSDANGFAPHTSLQFVSTFGASTPVADDWTVHRFRYTPTPGTTYASFIMAAPGSAVGYYYVSSVQVTGTLNQALLEDVGSNELLKNWSFAQGGADGRPAFLDITGQAKFKGGLLGTLTLATANLGDGVSSSTVAFEAVPIDDQRIYKFRLKHRFENINAPDAQVYIRERATALPGDAKYVDVASQTSYQPLWQGANSGMPTTVTTLELTYTPTVGTKYASLVLYSSVFNSGWEIEEIRTTSEINEARVNALLLENGPITPGADNTGGNVAALSQILPNWTFTMEDPEGLPGGIYPIEGGYTTGSGVQQPRAQLIGFKDETPGTLNVRGSDDAGNFLNNGVGFPAVEVDDKSIYAVTVRYSSSVAVNFGLYLRMYERNTALDTGETHVHSTTYHTYADFKSNQPMPGTAPVTQTYNYIPTAGSKYVTFGMYSWACGADLYVESVQITRTIYPSRVDALALLNGPAQAGADVTGSNTAAYIVNQGTAATADSLADFDPVSAAKILAAVPNATLQAGVVNVARPDGGHLSGSGTTTGAIQILLPAVINSATGPGNVDAMIRFTVDVFEYTTGATTTYYIAGYTYKPGPGYVNCTARMVGGSAAARPVRFGRTSGGRWAVWIGDATGTWEYPGVTVKDVQVNYGLLDGTLWDDGWELSFKTGTLGTVDTTFVRPHPGDAIMGENVLEVAGVLATNANYKTNQGTAAYLNNQGDLATQDAVTWDDQVEGVGKPADNAGTIGLLKAVGTGVTVVGNSVTKKSPAGHGSWDGGAVGALLANTAFVSCSLINPESGGTWITGLALGTSSTNVTAGDQNITAHYTATGAGTGTLYLYDYAFTTSYNVTITGVNNDSRMFLVYDGVNYTARIGTAELKIPATPGLSLYPKVLCYHLDGTYTPGNSPIHDVQYGPWSENAWASVGGSGKPADNATATVKLTAIGDSRGATVGNTYYANGASDYAAAAVGSALYGACFVECDINNSGYTMVSLDDDATNYGYTGMNMMAQYAGGSIIVYSNGTFVGGSTTTHAPGAKLRLIYNGTSVYVLVGSYLAYAGSGSALAGATHYPKLTAYNGLPITGFNYGPYNDSTFAALGDLGLGRAEYQTSQGTSAYLYGQGDLATQDTASWYGQIANKPSISTDSIIPNERMDDPDLWRAGVEIGAGPVPASWIYAPTDGSDSYSVRPGVYSNVFSRAVDVEQGETYEASWEFMQAPSASTTFDLLYPTVALYDSSGNHISGDGTFWRYPGAGTLSTAPQGEWMRFSYQFGAGTADPIPAAAKKISIGALLNYNGSVAHSHSMRRVTLRKITSEWRVTAGGNANFRMGNGDLIERVGIPTTSWANVVASRDSFRGGARISASLPVFNGNNSYQLFGLTEVTSPGGWDQPGDFVLQVNDTGGINIYYSGNYVAGYAGWVAGSASAQVTQRLWVAYDGLHIRAGLNQYIIHSTYVGPNKTYWGLMAFNLVGQAYSRPVFESYRTASVVGTDTYKADGTALSQAALVTGEGTAAYIANQTAFATANFVAQADPSALGDNLVANGNFRTNAALWTLTGGWSYYALGAPYPATGSVYVTAASTGSSYAISQLFPFLGDALYVSADVYSSVLTDTMLLYVRWHDSNDAVLTSGGYASIPLVPSATGVFKRVSGRYPRPAGAAKAVVYLQSSNPTGTHYVTNVRAAGSELQADNTAKNQITVPFIEPIPVASNYKAEVKEGELPVSRQMSLYVGNLDASRDTNWTVTPQSGLTVTIDNTAGSITRGRFTVTALTVSEASFTVTAVFGDIQVIRYIRVYKNIIPAVETDYQTGGYSVWYYDPANRSAQANHTDYPLTTYSTNSDNSLLYPFHSNGTEGGGVKAGSDGKLEVYGTIPYSTLPGSGVSGDTTQVAMKVQYAPFTVGGYYNSGTVWTDMNAEFLATVPANTDGGQTGSVSISFTKTGLTANAEYMLRLMAREIARTDGHARKQAIAYIDNWSGLYTRRLK